MTRSLRALAWACAGAGVLVGGAFALGLGLVGLRLASGATAASPGLQQAALRALVGTVAREALLPHAALTLVGWLVLARLAPRVDASWRALAGSLLACAVLAFPVVGLFTFEAWSPTGPADVVGTASLLSGSVALALWLGRRAVPGLRPGSFAAAKAATSRGNT
jgi:hypothetical protein